MVNKVTEKTNKLDWLFWSLALISVSAGFSAEHFLTSFDPRMKMTSLVVAFVTAGLLLSRTSHAIRVKTLWQDSLIELRKIVWPTRSETVQSVIAVLSMVVVMCVLLWTVDAVLIRFIAALTGHGGGV